ncbi:MAG TPA: sigma-70 family RNA polymerase sigma factor [Tepidisphaeraceae bacterium]|nr:sigma-70 family RNA polymerase sigma factor [Tepidisphaeraceae bacterium]
MDDATLLQRYVETGSEDAFGQLTSRHIGFVYAAALRHVHDRHVAEEIVQAVFIVLARKASTLRHEAVLSSWLLSTTRYAALGHMKMAARRKRHERRAAEMAKTVWEEDAERSWPQYEGELDAALASLRESDRRAVMLRFYEHKSFDEIAAILGTAEEAARKRVSRAVEKLRGHFGVGSRTLPATMVTYFLYSKLATAPPAGLAAKVTLTATQTALAGGAATGAGASAELARQVAQQLLIMKAKWITAGLAAAMGLCVGAGALVFHLTSEPDRNPSIPVPAQRDYRNR